MNFYKRYLGDYARDTAHLSLMEHGAYQVLLDTYYATDGALPADPDELYRIARAMTPAERKAVDRVAGQFFAVNGDGTRHNKRADEEIASAAAYADAQSIRANKRWQMQAHMPPHEPMQCPDDASHSHSQKEQKLSPDGFVKFWEAWPSGPRKQAKGKCLTLWRKKNLEALETQIVEHVAAMKATEDWRKGFVPAPLVYLKDERWDGAEVLALEEKRMVM